MDLLELLHAPIPFAPATVRRESTSIFQRLRAITSPVISRWANPAGHVAGKTCRVSGIAEIN